MKNVDLTFSVQTQKKPPKPCHPLSWPLPKSAGVRPSPRLMKPYRPPCYVWIILFLYGLPFFFLRRDLRSWCDCSSDGYSKCCRNLPLQYRGRETSEIQRVRVPFDLIDQNSTWFMNWTGMQKLDEDSNWRRSLKIGEKVTWRRQRRTKNGESTGDNTGVYCYRLGEHGELKVVLMNLAT